MKKKDPDLGVYRYELEDQLWQEGYSRVMGLDEVGRGCLCGPVVAAGVILKPGSRLSDNVRDSKTLSARQREELVQEIEHEALYWTIQHCTPREIDRYNISNASIRAMLKCAEEQQAAPDFLLVDGNRFAGSPLPHRCVIKGDDRSASIAAASILAKVYRDRLMLELHHDYPYYGWDTNMGYPTKAHYEGLTAHGFTEHHRQSFNLRTRKAYTMVGAAEKSDN
ncbi:MAG: ribonuclease HII [Balneolaceae bacterium]